MAAMAFDIRGMGGMGGMDRTIGQGGIDDGQVLQVQSAQDIG